MVSDGRVAALGQTITMEMKHDIHENVILRDIWRDGLTKGHAEGKAEGALFLTLLGSRPLAESNSESNPTLEPQDFDCRYIGSSGWSKVVAGSNLHQPTAI